MTNGGRLQPSNPSNRHPFNPANHQPTYQYRQPTNPPTNIANVVRVEDEDVATLRYVLSRGGDRWALMALFRREQGREEE